MSRQWLRLVAFGLLALAFSVSPVAADPIVVGKVIAIQDGDTLTLLDESNQQLRIRIGGIDAPEKSQPFGQASKENLAAMAFGEIVTADCPKVDRYRRLVCIVRVGGTDVGLAQVQGGLAWHYKQYAGEQSPEDRDAYASAEEAARVRQKGLWKDATPVPPWEFRRSKRTSE